MTVTRDAALAALQAMLDRRLDLWGGYPATIDGKTIPGYVIVADESEHDSPTLTIFRWQSVLRWYRRALTHLENTPSDERDVSYWDESNDAVLGIGSAMADTQEYEDDLTLSVD